MRKSTSSFYQNLLLILFLGINYSYAQRQANQNTEAYASNIPSQYVHLINKLIMQSGIAATNAARIHGYVGIALYESINYGSPKYRSLTEQLNGFDTPPKNSVQLLWDVVADETMHNLTDSLFAYIYPTLSEYNYIRASLDTLQKKNKMYFNKQYKNAELVEKSRKFGIIMADFVFKYSKNDGGYRKSLEETVARDYTHYQAPSGSSWDDTKTRSRISVQPTWGKNRTFVKDIYAQTKPAAPFPFSKKPTSDFYKQALEVYDISRELTFDQRLIAEYWRDEATVSYTPGGHTVHILMNALEKERASLDKFAYAYAKTGIALNDAFICCWETKYLTNCIRPITYIQEVIDKRFKPSFYTPAFPEYTSGHSTQWGASAEVLSSIFGNSYAFTDQTDYLRDKLVPRNFKSFDEAAQEASMSRIYGGIHFRQACEVGLEQGKRIGRSVNKLNWLK
jgi:hypothetical protein